jgi:hypothetical protein
MKVNQIVGEHKKGVRAHKYTKKPVDHSVAHAKAKEKLQAIKPMEDMAPPQTTNSQGTAGEGTIVASDEKSVTVQMPDGTQIKKDLLGGVTTDANGNPVFQAGANPQQAGTTPQQQTPQQKLAAGTKIAVNTQPQQQTMGSPATMEEGLSDILGFNKSPEEWAKTSQQMATLLQFKQKYQGTQYASQIEQRIKLLTDRLNGDAGEVAGPGGIPKPVVPPEQFDMKQLRESDDVLLEKMRTIAGLR